MPRANRHFIPGHIWHITHRCHQRDFLLKFVKDRQCWIHWLYEAKKRYGLCVLNYIVTSNHIHLLVMDTGSNCIAQSMQLVAGRSAQTYNHRKRRKGAFWEDRYHATAIENDEHLLRCMIYIDLNMVRAGVVQHPSQWQSSGYTEIQTSPKRKRIIDTHQLMMLLKIDQLTQLQQQHYQWTETELKNKSFNRNAIWSESVAVGGLSFVERIQKQMGVRASGRNCTNVGKSFQLKETEAGYHVHFTPNTARLNAENSYFWDENAQESIA